ncbi:MAG TPA: class I SAM-dependent rRNA methyltransferase [Thermoanaerobaculia bacterium]
MFETSQRRRLYLKRDRARAIANRHPWIFSGAIAREEGPENAALADLIDAKGDRVASGFHSRHSQIRLRALVFDDEELTQELLTRRIEQALGRRDRLLSFATNTCRLVHAEGDELSGLIVDQYADVLVIEITSAGLESIRDAAFDVLRSLRSPRTILVKNGISARKLERISLEDEFIGPHVAEVEVVENGSRFIVALEGAQKTGLFLDQRDNRALARTLALGKRVLNLFSYSGGFGVAAAAGGATSVEEVDISEPAIELARRHHSLNASRCALTFTVADAFAHVRALVARNARFDLVVCDPPAFARSRGEVERAARGYKDVNLYAMKLVERGGMMMTFSCSGHLSLDLFQKVIFSAANDVGRRVSFVRRLTAGEDHPVSLYCPEGEYLKGFLLQFDNGRI